MHSLKYRLAYVVEGECVLRYDNEAGKGDHRHVGTNETPYAFVSIDKLAGPVTLREAARRVGRDVRAVHSDVHMLLQAGVLRKDDEGRNQHAPATAWSDDGASG